MTSPSASAFAGFRFPREVTSLAVRWYLRYGLSYRDVEELLAERGVDVDHVTVFRWVQRFTPEFVEVASTCRRVPGERWFVGETYVKVNGRWTYLYRVINQYGQVIDVWLSTRRDLTAARAFFHRALATGVVPVEVTTDRAPVYPRVLDELVPAALHTTQQYANNAVEADHGRLKARLRPMRGLKTIRSARILATGHAFVQNLDAATTTSPPTYRPTRGCWRLSMSWRSPSDPPAAAQPCRWIGQLEYVVDQSGEMTELVVWRSAGAARKTHPLSGGISAVVVCTRPIEGCLGRIGVRDMVAA